MRKKPIQKDFETWYNSVAKKNLFLRKKENNIKNPLLSYVRHSCFNLWSKKLHFCKIFSILTNVIFWFQNQIKLDVLIGAYYSKLRGIPVA